MSENMDKDLETVRTGGTAEVDEADLFEFTPYSPDDAERTGYSDYSYWKSVFQNFLKKKSAVVMACIFLVVLVFSFVALNIAKFDYATLKTDSSLAFIAPWSEKNAGRGYEFWFGTDNLGRDYWCQVWYAAQVSIKLAMIVAVGECIVGVIMGCLWGYVPHRSDGGPELHHHGGLPDLYRLAGHGPKRPEPGAHVP